jgi:ribosomal protein S12 methylthiotransferase
MLAQQEIAFARNKERIGSRLACLVDVGRVSSLAPKRGRAGTHNLRRTGRGRFYGQAPDIDSLCFIEGCSAAPGRFVDTKVVGTRDYDLVVEQI